MLKVCKCGARPAHSLEECPQCGAKLAKHGDQFLWDYEVDNEIEKADAVEAVSLERPKNGDNVEAWRTYARRLVDAAGHPEDAPDVDGMTKEDLIKTFG